MIDLEHCDEICSAVATGSAFTKMDMETERPFKTLSLKIYKSTLFLYPQKISVFRRRNVVDVLGQYLRVSALLLALMLSES